MCYSRIVILLVLSILLTQPGRSQEGCITSYGSIYGSSAFDERGASLAIKPDQTGFYLGGVTDGQTLLMELDLNGKIIWSRSLDIVPSLPEDLGTINIDTDGNIILGGIAGDPNVSSVPYAAKYNPGTDEVMWALAYPISFTRTFFNSIDEIEPGGNYLLIHNPHDTPGSNDDAEVVELDRKNGTIVQAGSDRIDFGSSESLSKIELHNGFFYSVGRYTEGAGFRNMRNTITKIDQTTLTPVWTKMGHVPSGDIARLYGVDLSIVEDEIYSLYMGDPSGTNLNTSRLYIQKTSLDGDLQWLKNYDLPGSSDWGYELQHTTDGLLVLAICRLSPYQVVIFKTDFAGQLIWAKGLTFPVEENADVQQFGTNQFVSSEENIVITGYGRTVSNTEDILLAILDRNGENHTGCLDVQDINVVVSNVTSPSFYAVSPNSNPITVSEEPRTVLSQSAPIEPLEDCILADITETAISTTICSGQEHEGYTLSGVYLDTFLTINQCDSIRTLYLSVVSCIPDACIRADGPVYGTPLGNERGLALAPSDNPNEFYTGGTKGDSVVIMKMNVSGQILWTRTFDIVPGVQDIMGTMILDSDGHLVFGGISGTQEIGGTIFVVKYDPAADQFIWSTEYQFQAPWNRTKFYDIIEKGLNGNYVITGSSHDDVASNNDVHFIELDRTNGDIVPGSIKLAHVGNSEYLEKIVFHNNTIYGCGRYSDGPLAADMRHTLTKMDPTTFIPEWTFLGHRPGNVSARLYGIDLEIEGDAIYSTYLGDGDGTSTVNTEVYIQKSDLDGQLLWINQYDLPGNTDWSHELVNTGDGIVLLTAQRSAQEALVLIKIDYAGNVIWSKSYTFPQLTNLDVNQYGADQLIRAGDHLVFTAFGESQSEGSEMVIVIVDSLGNAEYPCMEIQDGNIQVLPVQTPVFYAVEPNVFADQFTTIVRSPVTIQTQVGANSACIVIDTLIEEIQVSICAGYDFEGYTQNGVYMDTLISVAGCDSIRILKLSVIGCEPIVHFNLDDCRSFMSDGSHMDFSEFIPSYPSPVICAELSASTVFLEPTPDNKHSCTPGIGDSPAMCIGAISSCSYSPGSPSSLVVEITINPPTDSIFVLTGLEFFERSPLMYNWISGPTGPNDYPQFYGLRILKNGTEIFVNGTNVTHLDWTLESFDFFGNPAFEITELTTIRVEWLPYCPVNNGADVSVWDIDEIRFFGGCRTPLPSPGLVMGTIATISGEPVEGAGILISGKLEFTESIIRTTNESGLYWAGDLDRKQPCFLKGYKNDDWYNGVSTLDLLNIQKHLLGKTPFVRLDQYVAADANGDDIVNVQDILELRKLLLGIQEEVPGNTSWRFGVWPQPLDHHDIGRFNELYAFEVLNTDSTQADFLGVKIGDLTGDVQPHDQQEIVNRGPNTLIPLYYILREDSDGQYHVEFYFNEIVEFYGIQMALDLTDFDVHSLEGLGIPLGSTHYHVGSDNVLNISWSSPHAVSVSSEQLLFRFSLNASKAKRLPEIALSASSRLAAQVYKEGEATELALIDKGPSLLVDPHPGSLVCTIQPNPFHLTTTISMNIPEPGEVRIDIFDSSGRSCYSNTAFYTAGIHKIEMDANRFSGAVGTFSCRFIYGNEVFMAHLVRI